MSSSYSTSSRRNPTFSFLFTEYFVRSYEKNIIDVEICDMNLTFYNFYRSNIKITNIYDFVFRKYIRRTQAFLNSQTAHSHLTLSTQNHQATTHTRSRIDIRIVPVLRRRTDICPVLNLRAITKSATHM